MEINNNNLSLEKKWGLLYNNIWLVCCKNNISTECLG